MAIPYRSTPANSLDELQNYYGEDVKISQTKFGQQLAHMHADLKEIINSSRFKEYGIVLSIDGTWGSGKSSFIGILMKMLASENAALIKYDSLYYGNVSEATDIFINSIFDEVKERYGVKLSQGSDISKNISPKFELSNGLPKFGLDFNGDRKPTEVIKDQIANKLRNLPGKMVVIIDDIDRVAEEHILHFLRLVRVLREIPNFIVILPVDKLMLEKLLKTQGIESPTRYLEKIIDKSYDINPEQGNSKDLFFALLGKKYPDIELPEELKNVIWDMYLWEISLATIKPLESNGQQRLTLALGSTDQTWQLLNSIQNSSGENLVREFMERTSSTYGFVI